MTGVWRTAARARRRAGPVWVGPVAGARACLVAVALVAVTLVTVPLAAAPVATLEGRVLDVGCSTELFAAVGLDDARAAAAVWISRVVDRLDIRASTDVRLLDNAPSALRSLEAAEVDLLVLSPLHYLEARTSPLLLAAFITSLDGQVGQDYVLLVARSYAGGGIADLRGGTMLVHRAGQGDVAPLWLDTYLLSRGLPESGEFFGLLQFAQRPSQAVLPVLFAQADVCLVAVNEYETMCDLNPQLRRDLRELDRSPRFGRGPICLRREVYDELSWAFDEGLLSLHSDPEGQQILTLFGVTRVVPFESRYMESLVDLVNEHERLQAGRREPAQNAP